MCPLVVIAVDDDSLFLTNPTAMLEDLGHTVFKATCGKQALGLLRCEKVMDLVHRSGNSAHDGNPARGSNERRMTERADHLGDGLW